jgi:mxaD protein
VTLSAVVSIISSAFPIVGAAHGPTRQVVKQQIKINAPAADVWAVADDFFALDKWHPAVLKSVKIDDKTRKLSLDEEGKLTLTEELKKLDQDKMKLKYKIIDMAVIEKFDFNGIAVIRKALPVDTYSSTIQVVAEGDTSVVSWTGKFYRGYMLNPPTP